jgi:hypothetical protein
MRTRRLGVLGCLVAALACLAGCGLPVNSSPQAIPSSEIPVALIASNTTQPSGPINDSGLRVPVYLLASDGTHLVRQPRYVHPPLTPQKVLDALEAGPVPTEFDQGIQTAIPPTADLVSGGVSDGLLTVNLDASYQALLPDEETDYFAQIVSTVMCLPTVTKGVVFYFDNQAVEPWVGNGSIAEDYIVDRSDYTIQDPPPCFSP